MSHKEQQQKAVYDTDLPFAASRVRPYLQHSERLNLTLSFLLEKIYSYFFLARKYHYFEEFQFSNSACKINLTISPKPCYQLE